MGRLRRWCEIEVRSRSSVRLRCLFPIFNYVYVDHVTSELQMLSNVEEYMHVCSIKVDLICNLLGFNYFFPTLTRNLRANF